MIRQKKSVIFNSNFEEKKKKFFFLFFFLRKYLNKLDKKLEMLTS